MEKGTPSESEFALGGEGSMLSMCILHVRQVYDMSRMVGKGRWWGAAAP